MLTIWMIGFGSSRIAWPGNENVVPNGTPIRPGAGEAIQNELKARGDKLPAGGALRELTRAGDAGAQNHIVDPGVLLRLKLRHDQIDGLRAGAADDFQGHRGLLGGGGDGRLKQGAFFRVGFGFGSRQRLL